jgi:hypothetical protein
MSSIFEKIKDVFNNDSKDADKGFIRGPCAERKGILSTSDDVDKRLIPCQPRQRQIEPSCAPRKSHKLIRVERKGVLSTSAEPSRAKKHKSHKTMVIIKDNQSILNPDIWGIIVTYLDYFDNLIHVRNYLWKMNGFSNIDVDYIWSAW